MYFPDLQYSYEVDYWAIGIILYVMLVGRAPFESSVLTDTYKKIQMGRYSYPESIEIHPLAKSFIS